MLLRLDKIDFNNILWVDSSGNLIAKVKALNFSPKNTVNVQVLEIFGRIENVEIIKGGYYEISTDRLYMKMEEIKEEQPR